MTGTSTLRLVGFYLGLVGIAALVALLAGSEQASARSQRSCSLPTAREIVRTTSAVVYRRPARPSNSGTFVCADAKRRNYWLGDGRGRERFLGPLTLVGNRAAYGLTLYENTREDLAEQRVRVKSAWSGRTLLSLRATSVPDPESPATPGGVKDVALTSEGGLAWISADVSADRPSYEVWLADKKGARMLAKSANIDPRSLAVSEALMFWSDAGVAFQAPTSGAARR